MDDKQSNVLDFEKKQKKPAKKRLSKALKAVLSLVIIVVIVLGVIAVVLLRGEISSSAVSRALIYYRRDGNSQGFNEGFTFPSGSDNVCAGVGNSLLIAGSTDARLYSRNGEVVFSDEIAMEHPCAASSEKLAAIADVGGSTLFTYNGVSERKQYSADYEIVGVSVGDGGQTSLITLDSGYKTSVLVLDSGLEPVYRASWSSGYAVCSAVSPNGRLLAVGLLTQSEGTVRSAVSFYPLDSETPSASYAIEGELIVDAGWISKNTLCCVCENSLVFLDSSGKLLGRYDYSDAYLSGYSLGGDGYAVVLLRSYQSGGTYSACALSPDGEVIGKYKSGGKILSVSASGGNISILRDDRLCIYNSEMELISESDEISGYTSAVTRSDGAVFLIGQSSADIYVP